MNCPSSPKTLDFGLENPMFWRHLGLKTLILDKVITCTANFLFFEAVQNFRRTCGPSRTPCPLHFFNPHNCKPTRSQMPLLGKVQKSSFLDKEIRISKILFSGQSLVGPSRSLAVDLESMSLNHFTSSLRQTEYQNWCKPSHGTGSDCSSWGVGSSPNSQTHFKLIA
jgi:hypothetical protein